MRALPASALITDEVAQIAYTMASAPHATISHKAVMEVHPFLNSAGFPA
jgi:hypothetical protein